MAASGEEKERYEHSLVERFIEETYGRESGLVFVERPDNPPSRGGRTTRPEGWPDFIYRRDKDGFYLAIELGRWNEGDQELWREKRVERFGQELRNRLKGRLPGFYILQLPYDLALPTGRGRVEATERLTNELAEALINVASQGASSLHIPISCSLVQIERPGSDIFVTPMKDDFLNNEAVIRDPVYLERFKALLAECSRKFTGFENHHAVLVLDVTDSKMESLLLIMLAQREWNLGKLVPSLAPTLKEIHLCEGMRVWSGAGGRQLRHKWRGETPSHWVRLWPGRMGMFVVDARAVE